MTAKKPLTDSLSAVNFAGLRDYIGYTTRQAQSAIFRDFTKITEEVGLTPGEFSLLTLIGANPGINQITLAALHGLDKSTLSLAIRDLKRQDLIESRRQIEDGRYYALHLTRQGEQRLRRTTQLVEEQERRMDKVLAPGERKLLIGLMKRISKAFD
ncbi:putative transcriptional regulatory protein for hcr operon [Rhodospirillaceae bacterium LM-1]|nr:putative transcriptional regulatory protein for hcr operon [Rhodospirillaceae bacterium LM-1]